MLLFSVLILCFFLKYNLRCKTKTNAAVYTDVNGGLSHYFLHSNSCRFLFCEKLCCKRYNCYKSRNYNPTNQKISENFFPVQPKLFNKFIYSKTRDVILQGIASCSLESTSVRHTNRLLYQIAEKSILENIKGAYRLTFNILTLN